jgi:hypothetical protein
MLHSALCYKILYAVVFDEFVVIYAFGLEEFITSIRIVNGYSLIFSAVIV